MAAAMTYTTAISKGAKVQEHLSGVKGWIVAIDPTRPWKEYYRIRWYNGKVGYYSEAAFRRVGPED